MNSLAPATPTPSGHPSGMAGSGTYGQDEDLAALKARRLEELARLCAIGVETAQGISRWLKGDHSDEKLTAAIMKGGVGREFDRTTRAICQVIALEMELSGERPAPDRDAEPKKRKRAKDGDDEQTKPDATIRHESLLGPGAYDNGPLDSVIARVRRELRTEAPANDPFAPPAQRKPRAETPAAEAKPEVPKTVAKATRPRTDLMASAAIPPRPIVRPPAVRPMIVNRIRSRGPPK
jgi:hypothetical protein